MAQENKTKLDNIDLSTLSDKEKRDLILSMRRLGGKKGSQKRAAPTTDDELHEWILAETGYDIPRAAVCEDHCAPFDYVADYYFEREDSLLVVGGRESAKTLNTAIANYAMAETKPGCEVCTFADIEAQSNKSYSYIKSFIYTTDDTGKKVVKSSVEGEPKRKETTLKTGSKLEVIIGTLSGVNSPHPQKVHADEVDLMENEVWQESRNMSSSKRFPDGRLIKAQDIATSTLKSTKGIVQGIINEAEKAKKEGLKPTWKIYKACVFEVAQEVPSCRAVSKEKREIRLSELGKDSCELCDCNEIAKGEWGENTPRTLESVCKGKFFKSRGWMAYSDVKRKFVQNSPAKWASQLECRRPMADGLYLPTWSRERYCVSKDTPVLTENGYAKAGDLVDNNIKVATIDGRFRSAEWFYAGRQKLYEIDFSNGEKIKATGNHLWPVRQKGTKAGREWAFTTELLDRRVIVISPIIDIDKENSTFKTGVQHGFTYGDGWLDSKSKTHTKIKSYLSNPSKQEFVKCWFDNVREWKNNTVNASMLPGNYKKLPETNDKNYLCGFLAGWIAADGCLAGDGIRIDCKSNSAIKFLDNFLSNMGILHSEVTSSLRQTSFGEVNMPSLRINADAVRNNSKWMVLRDNQKPYKDNSNLKSVKVTSITELWYDDVVCCEEKDTHTWVTSGGIVTGNCIKEYEPRPEYGYIWQGIDWGGSSLSTSAIVWIQGPLHQPIQVNNFQGTKTLIPQGAYVIFKEIYEAAIGATRLADKVVRVEIQYRNRYGAAWRVKGRFADKAGAQQRADWREHDPPLRTHWYLSGKYFDPTVECVQSLVSDSLLYADGASAPGICDDFESWRSESGKEVHDESSHGPASARYALKNVQGIVKRYNNPRQTLQPVVAGRDSAVNPTAGLVGVSSSSADYSSERWRETLGQEIGGNNGRGGREPWQP